MILPGMSPQQLDSKRSTLKKYNKDQQKQTDPGQSQPPTFARTN